MKAMMILLTMIPVLASGAHDVCNTTLHPVPLNLGDSGTVMASYSTVAPSEGDGCRMQLLGCDSCRLRLTINTMSVPVCNDSHSQLQYPVCVRGCMHVIVYEPSYADVSTSFLFDYNATWTFYSISSSVVVMFCSNISRDLNITAEFSLIYQVIEKQEVYLGSSRNRVSSTGSMQSPNFPHGYALRGEVYSYLLRNLDRRGRIRVVFDDWDLADVSRVMFYQNDSQVEPFAVHFGSSIRPVVVSAGRTLYMTFRPDVGINARADNMGFRARYEFIRGKGSTDAPSTDCGMYYKYSPGGRVEFYGRQWKKNGHCDCIWVIPKHSAFDWLHLSIRNFSAGNSIVMTIRDGVTSTSPIINHINTTSMENDTLTLEALSGFYMRLQGSYTVSDYIDMTFTAFSLPHKDGSCHKSSEFKCRSRHCIDRHLVCDGHNHCEDGVDEQEHCRKSTIQVAPVVIQCKHNEFTCANRKRCVPLAALCDKWLDCPDGSDEYTCAPGTTKPPRAPEPTQETQEESCTEDQWRCHSRDQCIPKLHYCDGGYQCWDRSDEMDCFMGLQSKSLSQPPWSILMPVGIALCVALFICVISLCIRSHLKHQQECGVAYSSGRPGNPQSAVRRSRRPKGRTQHGDGAHQTLADTVSA